jgi:hypothetical protein
MAKFEVRNLKTNRRLVYWKKIGSSAVVYHCGLSCDCTVLSEVGFKNKDLRIQHVIEVHNREIVESKRNRNRETSNRPTHSQAGAIPRSVTRLRRALDLPPVALNPERSYRITTEQVARQLGVIT